MNQRPHFSSSSVAAIATLVVLAVSVQSAFPQKRPLDRSALEASSKVRLEKVETGRNILAARGISTRRIEQLVSQHAIVTKRKSFGQASGLLDQALESLRLDGVQFPDEGAESTSAEPPAFEPVDQTELRTKVASLWATNADIPWKKIAWEPDLARGLAKAAKTQKPMLLWVFIDRPIDDRRC